MTNTIEIANITRRYSGQPAEESALRGVTFSVPAGSIFGLVGPDGAGKSSLMRILATVHRPNSGSAAVAGFDVVKSPESVRRVVGYMPQNYSLYPDLTVLENLDFFADMHAVPRLERANRLQRLLDFSRLGDFQHRRSGQLSGGMRKKLALACALLHDPRVILLDEPTTGVDPVSRRDLWELLTQVAAEGVTVFVSTPYMDEAERCQEIAMLYRGGLLTIGKPLEMIRAFPGRIIEVKSSPRGAARKALMETKNVISWRPVGDRFRARTENAEKLTTRLEKHILDQQARVVLLRDVRASMEDVFIQLLEGRGQQL